MRIAVLEPRDVASDRDDSLSHAFLLLFRLLFVALCSLKVREGRERVGWGGWGGGEEGARGGVGGRGV